MLILRCKGLSYTILVIFLSHNLPLNAAFTFLGTAFILGACLWMILHQSAAFDCMQHY